jgi:hypothetical protein
MALVNVSGRNPGVFFAEAASRLIQQGEDPRIAKHAGTMI